jgi:Ca2+-binding RTX toxin-like protein
MAPIKGTKFNDNNTVNGDGKLHKSLVGTDQQWEQSPNGPVLTLGNDVIHGLEGNDELYGRGGSDRLYGGSGHDYLVGDSGNDKLYGGSGRELMYGGAGNDKLYGDSGDDALYGNSGNDILTGGIGKDYLYGFSEPTEQDTLSEYDTLSGGADADYFVLGAQPGKVDGSNFYTGDGFALITDFNSSQGDKIALKETVDKYSLVSGNFGYGNPNVQDTRILFGNDQIGVLQDITNVKATDFVLGHSHNT